MPLHRPADQGPAGGHTELRWRRRRHPSWRAWSPRPAATASWAAGWTPGGLAPERPRDRDKLNVKGSRIAAGDPPAATGGRILGKLAKTLAKKGPGASISVVGGQGVTVVLER